MAADSPTPKQTAGLELLKELRGDFDSVHETLAKILTNIVNAPSEPKYRKLRTTNDRIKALLLGDLGGTVCVSCPLSATGCASSCW